jgi:hypothetical protein
MNDTRADAERRLRELFMARSGSDRVLMAFEMFDFARALVIADIKAVDPAISDAELRVRIFERFYGDDFDADSRARIAAAIRSNPTSPS